MSLIGLLLEKGLRIGKTFSFKCPQRTRGGGRAGRFPDPPRRVAPPCQIPASTPGTADLPIGSPSTPSTNHPQSSD